MKQLEGLVRTGVLTALGMVFTRFSPWSKCEAPSRRSRTASPFAPPSSHRGFCARGRRPHR